MKPLLGSGIQLDTEYIIKTDNGEHDMFAHYAPKDEITEALINGTPIMALCGKVWIPSRNPERYQTCPECKEIYETLLED